MLSCISDQTENIFFQYFFEKGRFFIESGNSYLSCTTNLIITIWVSSLYLLDNFFLKLGELFKHLNFLTKGDFLFSPPLLPLTEHPINKVDMKNELDTLKCMQIIEMHILQLIFQITKSREMFALELAEKMKYKFSKRVDFQDWTIFQFCFGFLKLSLQSNSML
jgi:hypothetical protein